MAAVNDGHMFDTPFNVVAGFRSRQQAETAARRLTSAGLPASSVEVADHPDPGGAIETAELRAEMQDELGRNWGAATGRQARGAMLGTTTFALGGLVVGLVIGFVANLGLGLDMSIAGTMAGCRMAARTSRTSSVTRPIGSKPASRAAWNPIASYVRTGASIPADAAPGPSRSRAPPRRAAASVPSRSRKRT